MQLTQSRIKNSLLEIDNCLDSDWLQQHNDCIKPLTSNRARSRPVPPSSKTTRRKTENYSVGDNKKREKVIYKRNQFAQSQQLTPKMQMLRPLKGQLMSVPPTPLTLNVPNRRQYSKHSGMMFRISNLLEQQNKQKQQQKVITKGSIQKQIKNKLNNMSNLFAAIENLQRNRQKQQRSLVDKTLTEIIRSNRKKLII